MTVSFNLPIDQYTTFSILRFALATVAALLANRVALPGPYELNPSTSATISIRISLCILSFFAGRPKWALLTFDAVVGNLVEGPGV
jgi:hypothetical protein